MFLAAVLQFQIACSQGTWKFFRGNNFDGHSSGDQLANQWSDKGPPILWVRDLGVGYSGFVGDSQYVYTQYQSLSGQFVICVDAKTGETVWEHRYAWPYKPASLYPGPRSSPTICQERIFFTTPNGQVRCLDRFTGKTVWQLDVATRFKAPAVEFGYACSPVCIDGNLILPVGGENASMVALDQKDGSIVWHSSNEKISYCSAFPIEFEGRKLVVGYFENRLCVYDRVDGSELVNVEISFDYDEHSAWPIYRAPYLWVSGPFRSGSKLFRFSNADDTLSLEKVYSTETMSNDVASSVLVDDALFGFDIRDVQSKVHRPSRGRFVCMDFQTGKELWANGTLRRRTFDKSETVSSNSQSSETDVGHSSVIYADGKLILFNDTGDLILCKADPAKFEQLARSRVLGGEICWVQPALIDRCFYIRNHSRAVCVFLGEESSSNIPAGGFEYASEIPQPQYFDLSAWVLGTEPKYAMTAPTTDWLTRWFIVSLGFGWVALPLIALVGSRVFKWFSMRTLWFTMLIFLGLLGTTVSGHVFESFYFSWPIVLFVVFEMVVLSAGSKSNGKNPWLARLMLVIFVVVCLAYFWFCRRLSLAFEWTFLMGFAFALPLLWLGKTDLEKNGNYNFKQWIYDLTAFTVFYWVGAGIIIWKYSGG